MEAPPNLHKTISDQAQPQTNQYQTVKISESPPPKYVSTWGNGLSKCFTYLNK